VPGALRATALRETSTAARRASVCVLVGTALALGTPVDSAQAAFPGRNGEIAVSRAEPAPGEECESQGACENDLRLLAVSSRTGHRRVLPVCTAAFCSDFFPSWSGDGRLLAFERSFGRIVVSRPDGVDLRTVTTGGSPAWSPDGHRLVFTRLSSRPNGEPRRDLYLISRDGSGLRRLTWREGDWPAWSSGGRIAFVRADRQESQYVYLLDRGNRPRRLARGWEPDWSPDGRLLVIGRPYRGREAVAIITTHGRLVRTLTTRGRQPAWSPDGRKIAFVRGNYLYLVRVGGGRVRRLARIRDPQGLDWRALPGRARPAGAAPGP